MEDMFQEYKRQGYFIHTSIADVIRRKTKTILLSS